MKVLVTGYSGTLGRAVTDVLLRRGHQVRGVVHSAAVRRDHVPGDVEIVWGALSDERSRDEWLGGVDAVVHCAWERRQSDPAQFVEANVDGTVELLRAASAAGVTSFVHVSSVAVYGLDAVRGHPTLGEDAPMIPDDDPLDIYPRTKAMLERRLADLALPATRVSVVRPGLLYDDRIAPAKRLVRLGGQGVALLFGRATNHLPYIHAADVADLIVHLLIDHDKPVVVNATPSVASSARQFVSRWGDRQRFRVRVVRLPVPAARLLALLPFLVARAMGRHRFRPNVDYQVATAVRDLVYSNERARALGWVDVRTASDARPGLEAGRS